MIRFAAHFDNYLAGYIREQFGDDGSRPRRHGQYDDADGEDEEDNDEEDEDDEDDEEEDDDEGEDEDEDLPY